MFKKIEKAVGPVAKYLGPLGTAVLFYMFINATTTEEKIQAGVDLGFDVIGYTGIGTPGAIAYDLTQMLDDAIDISGETSDRGIRVKKMLEEFSLPDEASFILGGVASIPVIGMGVGIPVETAYQFKKDPLKATMRVMNGPSFLLLDLRF